MGSKVDIIPQNSCDQTFKIGRENRELEWEEVVGMFTPTRAKINAVLWPSVNTTPMRTHNYVGHSHIPSHVGV